MIRLIKMLSWTISIGWVVLTFFASNSPIEVSERIKAWIAIPWLQNLFYGIIHFAGNTFVLATTFFLLGAFVSYKRFQGRTSSGEPTFVKLGTDMRNLKFEIENLLWNDRPEEIVAQADVLATHAKAKGIAFPRPANIGRDINKLLPYLTHVSARLLAEQIPEAKAAAVRYSTPPVSPPTSTAQ